MFCPAGTATAVVDWPAEPDHQNHDSTFVANAPDPDSTAMRGAGRLLMHTTMLSVELHTSLGSSCRDWQTSRLCSAECDASVILSHLVPRVARQPEDAAVVGGWILLALVALLSWVFCHAPSTPLT
jgi:hypothetical protein